MMMMMTSSIRILLSAFLIPLLLVSSSAASPSSDARASQYLKPKHGAVACESEVCSNVGGSILKLGGSAADAMIATVLCVGVIDAHHSGIGEPFLSS
jgi:gamma-glutamyltranspeptidase/glutathione hydrolase